MRKDKRRRGERRGRRGRRRRRPKTYPSFAAALEERSGLRQASFAMRAADVDPVIEAKRRFGPRAVARFVGAVLRELMRLMRCQRAEVK